MATKNPAPTAATSREPSRGKVQDLPGCIKYILLVFIILLFLAELYSGEFRNFPDLPWVIWLVLLIKLLLIALLIWLIKVQKTLKCQITSPAGGTCVTEEVDTVDGILFIRVKGTASGSVFGHYTLAISGPYPYNVIYPAGGGTIPVNNAELGKIDTTALDNGDYTITLTVFPIGAGSPKTCTVSFTLLKIAVYITRAAGVPAVPNWYEQDAELVQGMHIVSVGGSFHLDGAAYVYTCVDRKIERYEIRYTRVAAPGPGPAQPLNDAAIPADWPAANQVGSPLVYDATKYWPWTKVGPAPMNLINTWTTQHWGAPAPGGTDYPKLSPGSWDSHGATPDPTMRGGRYSLLLIVHDTADHYYYDMQRIWLDNWPVVCKIVKFQRPGDPGAQPPEPAWVDLEDCTDILMSWERLRIIGLAWDALTDDAWPATAPNDNFDSYSLAYQKEFSASSDPIPVVPAAGYPLLAANRRVPDTLTPLPGPLPNDANADLLVEWDLTTLDAGALPGGTTCETAPDVGNQLYRGCACTFTLSLGVSDKTVTETVGDYYSHHPGTSQPIKIINDL
jgi:hypothetical protein